MLVIEQVKEINAEIVDALSRLMLQLSPDGKIPGRVNLERIVSRKGSYLFIARNPDIIATLTLLVAESPLGAKAWIEDVIVDKEARGQQVGEKLLIHAIDFAKTLDISSINLTSMPERVAANKLYHKVGFEKRETNVYRLMIR
ncbi:MAG: GNAT family N-acetyltransferase [Bacteroidales bacterium]|jgi:ribosomal protein S18 acetylase RimI-like enzyme|nr:GNAT family N-acetyltransferase [Bacteroidales bacterium]